ncbi:MAG: thiol:disulfide interchange protein DsbA/DsbL [Pseudomonadota bacterium]|nr:thiol:disulfide interchange protein DsbA/DsbL [Pseudomonadota bacterium]
MRVSRRLALLGLALALAACGKQQSAQDRTAQRTTAPAAISRPAAGTQAEASQQKSAQASEQTSKITRLNEDGSEAVEEVTSDSGAHNPLLAAVASTVAATTPVASAGALTGPTLWQEGVNYTRLVPTQPTAAPAGQVEVLEFFWYACPHCNGIDPLVESWKKAKPSYIAFSRVHVMWNEGHRSLARLYYTLVALGKIERLHGEVFKEIHVNGNPLVAADPNDTAESERIQTIFAKKFGIREDDFRTAYHSISVETSLQRADQLVQRYRIDGVPTFVVNGKFVADARTAGSSESLLSLISDLAAQEYKH